MYSMISAIVICLKPYFLPLCLLVGSVEINAWQVRHIIKLINCTVFVSVPAVVYMHASFVRRILQLYTSNFQLHVTLLYEDIFRAILSNPR